MKILNTVPYSLWEDVANHCDYATFFHTPQWAEIVSDSYPQWSIAAKAFQFGKDEWAVMPLMKMKGSLKGFFYSLTSNVFGVYGGPIANHPLSVERYEKILEHTRTLRAEKVEIFGNPYLSAEPGASDWKRVDNMTHIIHLDDFKSEEDFLCHYTRMIRKAVVRSKDAGYRCRPAAGVDDIFAYFKIYQDALSRYGSSATGRKHLHFFTDLFNRRSERIQFWLVERNAAIAGGILCFAHNKHFVAWHAAFSDDEFGCGVAKFMHHQMILHAKKSGHSYYDFNPSGGHEGTIFFKDRFHAERKPFRCLKWDDNPAFRVYDTVESRLKDKQFISQKRTTGLFNPQLWQH